MTTSLHAGETGTPLPDDAFVLRLIKISKDGMALETHFAVMNKDDNPPLYSISVWAENLTTPLQAREFMGENKAAYMKYCRLSVTRIRTLTTPEITKPVLDVVWDKLYIDGTTQADLRPGAEGHSGITGLKKPPNIERRIYKTLRTRLADMANEDLRDF